MNGKVINGTQQLLDAWVDHLSKLAKSQVKDYPQLMDLCNQVDGLLSQSMENEEFILDVPFSTEEVERAVRDRRREKLLAMTISWQNILSKGDPVSSHG